MKFASKNYSVNELAKFYGVSGDTIRYYDNKGILPSKKNMENNYRIFDRDDFIAMDAILGMRKMAIPLEDIKKLVNQFSFEEIVDFYAAHDEEIQAQIKKMMKIQMRIEDYRYTLSEVRDGLIEFKVLDIPAIICKEISTTAYEAMESFDNLSQGVVPFITVTIPECYFMTESSLAMLLSEEFLSRVSEISFTSVDWRNIHEEADFPDDEFEIIPGGKCLYFAESIVKHSNYSVMQRMLKYLHENNFELKSAPPVRIVSTQIQSNTDFYEYIIPLK